MRKHTRHLTATAGVITALTMSIGTAHAAPNSSGFTAATYYDPVVEILDAQRAAYGFAAVGAFDTTMPLDTFDTALLAKLNTYRAANGVEPVQESEALRAAVAIQINKNLTGSGADDLVSTDIEAICGIGSSFDQDTAISSGKTAAEVFDFWVTDGSRDLLAPSMTAAPATITASDGRQQSFMWYTNSTTCIDHPATESEPELGPAPKVRLGSLGPVLGFDVNPNRASANYTVKVEKKQPNGAWSVVKSVRTSGRWDIGATMVSSAGRYRVVVPPQFGAAEGISNTVTVTGPRFR